MTPARILIVDDEEEIVRLLARRLRRQRYQVITATEASQALVWLQEAEFDAAILDFMLPGMSGLELAKQCRARYPGLKILILTGSPIIAEIEAAGIPCLRKPLQDLQDLDVAIEQLLAPASKERIEGEQR